jgi:hypothetical protein
MVWIRRSAVARGRPAALASADTLAPSVQAAVARRRVMAFWTDRFSLDASCDLALPQS